MAELPFRMTPDKVVQQAVEPMRRRLNELERQAKGVQASVKAASAGVIRFELIKGPDAALQEHDIVLTNGVTTKLTHGLGTKLRGWVLIDVRDGSLSSNHHIMRVTTDGTSDADDSKDLWLTQVSAASTITVRVMVF